MVKHGFRLFSYPRVWRPSLRDMQCHGFFFYFVPFLIEIVKPHRYGSGGLNDPHNLNADLLNTSPSYWRTVYIPNLCFGNHTQANWNGFYTLDMTALKTFIRKTWRQHKEECCASRTRCDCFCGKTRKFPINLLDIGI